MCEEAHRTVHLIVQSFYVQEDSFSFREKEDIVLNTPSLGIC